MKIFYIECTEDELRANRRFMDEIMDAACQGIVDTLCGRHTPACKPEEPEDEESEGE